MKLSDDLQVEILLMFGAARWDNFSHDSSYWQRVYDYLKIRHPHILKNFCDYPAVNDHDMHVLECIYEYQKAEIAKAEMA